MKVLKTAGLLLALVGTVFFGWKPVIASTRDKQSAEAVLRKVSKTLGGLKSLKYRYQLDLNYASEGYKASIAADVYLDFASVDKVLGMRYQFNTDSSLFVFNGSEKFDIDKKAKTIAINDSPVRTNFDNDTYFNNSPATLRNVLPEIAADSTIPKTLSEAVVDGRQVYLIEFVLTKKVLGRLSGFDAIDLDRKTIYRLTVDKKSFLPMEVLQKNSSNDDFTKTTISNLTANASAPSPLSWFYSTYLSEYKRREQNPNKTKLIAVGESAPEWNLPVFESDTRRALSQFKNKVVMLEFWISYCGYCVAAVPRLNAIAERYKGKEFKPIGINMYDSPEVIGLFRKNNKPVFEILTSGQAVADEYGVDRFPTIVLIDKSGKVIYSGGFDEKKIDELIREIVQ